MHLLQPFDTDRNERSKPSQNVIHSRCPSVHNLKTMHSPSQSSSLLVALSKTPQQRNAVSSPTTFNQPTVGDGGRPASEVHPV